MATTRASTDPRFLLFKGHAADSPFILRNNCVSFAASNDATVEAYEERAHPLLHKPDLGDGVGIPYKLHQIAFGYDVSGALALTEKNGAIPLDVTVGGAIPKAPYGYRRVAMFYYPAGSESQYHFLREGQDGVWVGKDCEDKPSDRDWRGQLVCDPRNAIWGEYCKGPWFFAVPEDGIEMRLSREWAKLLVDLDGGMKQFNLLPKPSPELAGNFSRAASLLAGRDDRLSSAMERLAHCAQTGHTKPQPMVRPRFGDLIAKGRAVLA